MTDIVEHLRWLQEKTWCGSEHWHRAAADEIEKLREVLRFYACECSDAEACETFGNYERSACGYKARAALKEDKPFEDRWDNA